MEANKLLESISALLDMGIFSERITDVLHEVKYTISERNQLQEEKEQLKRQMILLLKSLIGQNIYWACPGWKIETHTITNVQYRVFNSDFFDTKNVKYKGKKCIVIEVDGDGNYLADFIGQSLFFDKEEAINRQASTSNPDIY